MEKRTARLFCGFGTFILLLCTVEVSSAPSMNSIMSAMENDNNRNDCKTPNFLYSSNYTKNCLNLPYPNDNTNLTLKNVDTFLCLGVYDASVKICNYTRWHNPFNSTSGFDAYVEKFIIGTGKSKPVEFCTQFKGIAPMYNKTRVFVSQLTGQLNNPFACRSICFNTMEEFNPLCAILAWINSVDIEVSKAALIDDTKLQVTSQAKSMPGPDSNKHDKKPIEQIKSDEKNADTNPVNVPIHNKSNLEKDQSSSKESIKPGKLTDADKQEETNEKSQLPLTSDSDPKYTKEESRQVISAPPASAANAPLSAGNKTAKASMEKTDAGKNNFDELGKIESSEANEKVKVTNSDIKTSTLSENTEDHEGTNDENESSCNDNGKFLSEADNILKASFDTGDLSPNIPETSEQRDLPHYRNPSPDEESHFFTYFTVMSLVFIVAYIGYHNKQKVLAIVLEGRRSRNSRGRRRPSTANYRKLDCTLEEAVTSQCNANVTHVIY